MKIKCLLVLIATGTVQLCLAAPRGQGHQRFPYVGTWRVQERYFQTSVAFDASGNCTWNYATGSGRSRLAWTNIACGYRMEGQSALTKYRLDYRFDKANKAAQVISALYIEKVTPLKNGKMLRLDMQEIFLKERKDNLYRTVKVDQQKVKTQAAIFLTKVSL